MTKIPSSHHFTFSRRTCAALLLVLTLLLSSCKHNSTPGSPTPATKIDRDQPPPKRMTPPVGSSRVKVGSAPLSYLIASGGNIRINDIGDDIELYRANVPPQTAITIDQQKGIQLGQDLAVPGPLPLAHRYEIYLDR